MRLTKKNIKEICSLSPKALPGSTVRTCLNLPDTIHDDESLFQRLHKNLEKWGWIENKGLYVITKLGFNEIPYIR